jgi:antibiotic biosynthesis monooxygenase (ABM) superfamily enzyme
MILFQLYFEVADQKRAEFERAYTEIFEPALRKQVGFESSKFLRLYGAAESSEIGAAPTEFNFQVNFVFDSEQNRRRWAASAEHDTAWPKFSAIARKALWRGYEVIA